MIACNCHCLPPLAGLALLKRPRRNRPSKLPAAGIVWAEDNVASSNGKQRDEFLNRKRLAILDESVRQA